MIGRPTFVVMLACATGAIAQDDVRARLDRLEQRLAEVRAVAAELETIVERHAGGDAVAAGRWLAVTEVDLARAASAEPAAAADAEARTDALRSELARLDAEVAAARLQARQRAIGDTLPRPEELARLAQHARAESAPPVPRPAPAIEGPVQVHGSTDHLQVGNALLEAGIDVWREAEQLAREGRAKPAEALRGRARELLQAARSELEAAVAGDRARAPLLALFSLARAEEKLGRRAEADALYAKIMERDRRVDREGLPVYGPFGRSARTARTVMQWLDDTAGWTPRRDVDRIRWDDR